MILVEYYIKKYENVFQFTFHGFAAHLKEYVSARSRKIPKYQNQYFLWKIIYDVFRI